MTGRPEIVESARRWIGTPYQHQASCLGAGADCLGLVRGVWRDVLGAEPETAPPYTADWDEVATQERLWKAAARHLKRRESAPRVGDVLLFRMRDGGVAKHLGILSRDGAAPYFIHAYTGHGVVESALSTPWQKRLVAQFAFPERSL